MADAVEDGRLRGDAGVHRRRPQRQREEEGGGITGDARRAGQHRDQCTGAAAARQSWRASMGKSLGEKTLHEIEHRALARLRQWFAADEPGEER